MRTLALLLICTPLLAIEQQGDKVVLSDDDRKTLANCAAEGGCQVWSQAEIATMLMIYRQRLLDTGAGCRRNSL